jgi:D-amino-acid dehydrogenase
VAPGLAESTYQETRVGLRPTSADERAVVGRVPGWANAWVATGHGANGLLQGPYSARALAHTMTDVTPDSDEAPLPASFDPARFD